jgi:hypothetical protein
VRYEQGIFCDRVIVGYGQCFLCEGFIFGYGGGLLCECIIVGNVKAYCERGLYLRMKRAYNFRVL